MWRSKRRRRTVRRAAVAGVNVEPLEGRTLMTVAPVALTPGTAAGPAAALATLTPTLTWSAVAGVNGYQVRVLDRTAGAYAVAATVGSTATSYAVPSGKLTAGHAFTWSVWDVIGKATVAPSARLNFGTPIPPAPVATPSVGTGSASRPVLSTYRPTLAWSAAPNVTGYVLHVTDATAGNVITHTLSAGTTSYTFADGELTPGRQYNWNVREVIGTTTTKIVSNAEHFQLPALPVVATLGPGATGGAGDVLPTFTPTFTWAPVTTVGGFSDYLLTLVDRTTGRSTPVSLKPSATSYALPAGQLVAGHRYVWDLRVVDGSVTGKVVPGEFRYFAAPRI